MVQRKIVQNKLTQSKRVWVLLSVTLLVALAGIQLRAAMKASTQPIAFLPAQSFQTGSLPFNLVLADFNGDGILDMAVANSGTDTVSVLIGNGDGTFTPASTPTYTVGNEPVALIAADLNGDGIMDIAVANELGRGASQALSVLIGNGDGTFKAAANYPGGQAPRGIAFGDFNNDGSIDLVVANNNGNNVTVYLNNGNGTFQAPVYYAAHMHPKAVSVGDFNNDGNLDLAVANHDSNDVSILLGNGNGTFAAPVNYAVGLNPRDVKIGNLRGGVNEQDLVTANGGTTTISVLLGNGNGTFQKQLVFPAGSSPRWVALADYNGDGILDVAASDYGGPDVDILFGDGKGNFSAPLKLVTGNNPTGVQAGDLSNDGKPDVVVTIGGTTTAPNHLVTVFMNEPLFNSPTSLTFPSTPLGSTSAAQTVTVTSTGSIALPITSTFGGADPGDFQVSGGTCGSSVPAGNSCTITVTFSPQAINTRTGTLQISGSFAGSPLTVALTGSGTSVSLSPSSIAFPAQTVGTKSSPVPVTLTNTSSTTTLSITAIAITGTDRADFTKTFTCGTSLPPSQSCTINVTFAPQVTGALSASLSVADNGGGSPQSIPLTGTGQ